MSDLSKRRRSSTETSPNSLQITKRHKDIAMHNAIEFEQGQGHGYAHGIIHPPRFASPRQTSPGGYAPVQYMPPQPGSLISEADIQRIALATKNMVISEFNALLESRVTPLEAEICALREENEMLARKVDDLEMYSRRSCIRVAGVPETEEDTTQVVLDIAKAVDVPLEKSDVVVSHRVGKTDPNRPRQIIARISNYDARHKLLKSNKTLNSKATDKQNPIPKLAKASVSQDLTKERNSAAFECRQLVRAGLAKLTFVWDGKIFVISNDDQKYKVQNIRDVKELVPKLPPKLQQQ